MRPPIARDGESVALIRKLQQRAVAHDHVDGPIRVADVEEIGVDPRDGTRAARHRADRFAARYERVVREDGVEPQVASMRLHDDDVNGDRAAHRFELIVRIRDPGCNALDRRRLLDDLRKRRARIYASGQLARTRRRQRGDEEDEKSRRSRVSFGMPYCDRERITSGRKRRARNAVQRASVKRVDLICARARDVEAPARFIECGFPGRRAS